MPAPSYIPAPDADFDVWFNNFQTLIAADPTDYGLIAGDATAITAAYTAWHAAYLLATNPSTRTSPAVAAKDAQRNSAEAVIRPYAQQVARNPGIDPDLKVDLGLNLPNPTRPPIPAPTAAPILGALSMANQRLDYQYRSTENPSSKKKPTGAVGVQIRYVTGTAAAVDPEAAPGVDIITKSPAFLQLSSGERGKTLTMWGRFFTRSGPSGVAQYGPWSDALVQIVN